MNRTTFRRIALATASATSLGIASCDDHDDRPPAPTNQVGGEGSVEDEQKPQPELKPAE